LNAVSGEATQSPGVSKEIKTTRQALIACLPASYRIELGRSVEEGTNANDALATFFPAMIAAMLIVVSCRCGPSRRCDVACFSE